ncbi:MAG TPA: hypothetical protein VI432_02250 [Candidatus Paceibacterota bacterium]
MNKKFVSLVILGIIFSAGLTVLAHGPMSFSDTSDTRYGMMEYMEEQVLGSDIHEEMEELMSRMFVNSMTETDTMRLTSLMNQYPGAGSMMMTRIGGGDVNSFWSPHMSGSWSGWFGFWSILVLSGFIVWWLVGLFLAIWLWRQIKSKK